MLFMVFVMNTRDYNKSPDLTSLENTQPLSNTKGRFYYEEDENMA